jgi:23S rRNA-/tRNA-specific pseudouridylate synthase
MLRLSKHFQKKKYIKKYETRVIGLIMFIKLR